MNQYENCPKGKYHDFKVLSSPYPDRGDLPYSQEQVEQCRLCGQHERYAFGPQGNLVNDNKYFRDHIRVFAQRDWGGEDLNEVFFYCNPGERLKLAQKRAEELKRLEKNMERDEHFEFAIKRALEDKDDGIKKR